MAAIEIKLTLEFDNNVQNVQWLLENIVSTLLYEVTNGVGIAPGNHPHAENLTQEDSEREAQITNYIAASYQNLTVYTAYRNLRWTGLRTETKEQS